VSVLVVCAANVCMSPLVARLLAGSLEVSVLSAGSRARPSMPACPVSNFSVGHVSNRLEVARVRSASLVLGMGRENLTGAIALVPSAQVRSFTLLEAARLASWLLTKAVAAPAHLAPLDRLAWWVERLHAIRANSPHARAFQEDLPDPHESAVPHDVVLPRLTSAVRTLSALLAPASAPS
jgi:protein-tyrosine phosphatase